LTLGSWRLDVCAVISRGKQIAVVSERYHYPVKLRKSRQMVARVENIARVARVASCNTTNYTEYTNLLLSLSYANP